MKQPDALQKLQYENQAIKAKAFDYVIQLENMSTTIQKYENLLGILAHKLGVVDMNKLDLNTLPDLLDSKLANVAKKQED